MIIKYCDEQIKWLKENMSDVDSKSKEDRTEIEQSFFDRFGFRRTYYAMMVKARRLGFRPTAVKIEVGVSRKVGRPDECDYICVSTHPYPKYTPITRYVWERDTGETLSKDDVIININGIENDPDVSSLRKITRSELLIYNRLDDDIPIETRVMLAQIQSRCDALTGRGVWTDEERAWLKSRGRRDGGHGFWVSLSREFNARFNKKRSNRDLIMMFYNNRGA